MAQKVAITLQDDLDGGTADETVRFAIGGNEYEIDLSSKNADAFRGQLTPFIEHARRERKQAARPARTTASRHRSEAIRTWARSRGLAVNARGRIPASVIAQYEASTR